MKVTEGNPTEPGIYAARQWYAWRILEWRDGKWMHPGGTSAWPAKATIDAHVGPLPVIARDYSIVESDFLPAKPMEFDL